MFVYLAKEAEQWCDVTEMVTDLNNEYNWESWQPSIVCPHFSEAQTSKSHKTYRHPIWVYSTRYFFLFQWPFPLWDIMITSEIHSASQRGLLVDNQSQIADKAFPLWTDTSHPGTLEADLMIIQMSCHLHNTKMINSFLRVISELSMTTKSFQSDV